jgi:transcriptional regulator with XRE-family HTH domain
MKMRGVTPVEAISEKEIGLRIRKFRVANRVGMNILAKRAGISKGFLSKIERGERAPAIATLIRISTALNTRISSLLESDGEPRRISIVRSKERQTALHYASEFGYKYSALVHSMDSNHMEPFVITYPRKPKRRGPGLQHPGEEFLMVMKGKIVLTLQGKEYHLGRGDAVYFDSSIPHWGRSIGRKEAEVLDISFVDKKP